MPSILLDARRGKRFVVRALLLPALMAGLAVCDNESESLTGSWIGTFTQEPQERSGTIQLSLSQAGASLGGRWEAEFPPAEPYGGTIEGTVSGSTIQARLLPDDSAVCPYQWTATSGDSRISGRYAAFDCRVEIVGEIDVRRQ
jgi:hypothetical protein